MDVDSSMAPEPDHDPAGPNNNGPATSPSEQLEPPSPAAAAPGSLTQPPQSPVVGPRTAPTYSVVNAAMDKKEDGPGPRCGHTLTAVTAVGEEGTPGYIGPRLILFGGATALEGNSGAASGPGSGTGTPTSAGSAGISMWFLLLCFCDCMVLSLGCLLCLCRTLDLYGMQLKYLKLLTYEPKIMHTPARIIIT